MISPILSAIKKVPGFTNDTIEQWVLVNKKYFYNIKNWKNALHIAIYKEAVKRNLIN